MKSKAKDKERKYKAEGEMNEIERITSWVKQEIKLDKKE